MSVVIIARVKGDPAKIRQTMAQHGAELDAITEVAKGLGALHHQFLEGDGEMVILDEWTTAEAFQQFFSTNADVAKVLQEAGVEGPPSIEVFGIMEAAGTF